MVLMRQDGSGGRFVLESNRDITARKEAEEQRQALDRKLQDVQRMESLGLLAGGIAHDFNNLLVAILGNAELALMDLAPESPAQAGIAQISAAARRAADLTRQLLAYAGRGQLVMQPIQLNTLVEEMLHLLRAAIAKNVVLHFTPASDLPPVMADATQIRQVLMNLVVNASEAIGTKSGVILVTTGVMWADQGYLAEALPGDEIAEGDFATIEVADNGAGMDAETQARIFDPFFTTKFTGRGLGLAATLGIMRGHRGAIRVYSEQGRGSTFKLLLPIVALEGQQEREVKDEPNWRGSGTILVVEDELEVRAIVGRTLERLGFVVLTAEDGRAGVELFQQRADEIRCVLLDMTMPHMSGAESFRRIRHVRPNMPVILMSGYSEQDTIMRFAGKGLDGFLQKPFRPQQLAALLQKVLG
jgi:signal transduction histidine kinase/CheY-like chemotaxis protein